MDASPEISIALSSPYGAAHEDEDEHRTTILQRLSERALNHPSDYEPRGFFPIWEEKIFKIACAFCVLFNPLFNYINIIHEDELCYIWDVSLMWGYIAIQSAIDLFYAMDIFVFSRRIHGKPNAGMPKWLPIIHRIYLCLPISQAIAVLAYCGTQQTLFKVLQVFFYPIQYTLRAYCTFGLISIKKRPNIESGLSRWYQAILDFLPFIIASHLFGSLWYGFAVGREVQCWLKSWKLLACNGDASVQDIFFWKMFACNGNASVKAFRNCNLTHIKALCDPADKRNFDFGIYSYALQSNFTRSTYLPRKLLYSFWWGLRNLSSFGSNLEPSFVTLEICFSILISISGVALFLIYLNATVEVSRKRSDQIRLRQKIQTMTPEIDMWLSRNYLCGKNKKLIKKMIMKNIQQKLEENKEVDVHNFFSHLPAAYRRQIMSLPLFVYLQKVPIFENMNLRVLKEIVNHFELVTYTKNCYIIREGEPLWKAFFITQGTGLSYKTSTNSYDSRSRSDTSIIKCLEKESFFGEELLDWAFTFASISDLPISSRTVMSQTRMDVFGISANNLRRVVNKFRLHFILNIHNLEHSPLEHAAASSLQATWRAKENRSTGWNQVRQFLNYPSKGC